jgi:hypothetical protein
MFCKQKDGRSVTTRAKDLRYSPIKEDSNLAIQQTLDLRNPQQKPLMGILRFVMRSSRTFRWPSICLFCIDTNKKAFSFLSFFLLPTLTDLRPVYNGLPCLLVRDTYHSILSLHTPQCHIHCHCGLMYCKCKAAETTVHDSQISTTPVLL